MNTPGKKKICLCITHAARGGAQVYVYNIALLLKDRYDVYVISSFSGDMRDEFLSMQGVTCIEVPALVRSIDPFNDISALFILSALFKQHRFDLVHVNSPKAACLGRIANVISGTRTPLVYTVHLLEFSYPCRGILERLYCGYEKRMQGLTDMTLVNSAYEREILVSHGFPHEKVRVILPGIDTAPFAEARARRRTQKGGARMARVLHVTSFKKHKDPLLFFRFARALLRKHPDVVFDVLGDGPMRASIQRKIVRRKLDDRIVLHGFTPQVAPFFARADLLVITSQRESMTYAVIESVISGVPILSAYRGALPEAVREGSNARFVERDPEAMAQAAMNLLPKATRTDTIGETLPSPRSEEFWGRDRMCDEVAAVYERLIV